MTQTSLVDLFADQGHLHLRDYWSREELAKVEAQVLALYAMQAVKISDYREAVQELTDRTISDWAKLFQIMEMLEAKDKEALYQVQRLMPSSQALRALFKPEFMGLCASLIGGRPETTLLDGPGLLVVRPNTDCLRYKWHSEAHYYPKRPASSTCGSPSTGRATTATAPCRSCRAPTSASGSHASSPSTAGRTTRLPSMRSPRTS